MNWIKVLKIAGPALNIIGSLISGYVSKHNMQQMIKEEVARVVKNG